MPEKKKEEQNLDPKDQESPSLEDTTQQMSPQNDQPTDDNKIDPNYVRTLEERIAAQQIQFRRMESLIETVANRQEEDSDRPTPRNIEAERAAFYQDPTGSLETRLAARDERILKQMQKMLEPLQQVATSFKSNSEYDYLKTRLKNDPVFSKGLRDPDVETTVDMIMKQEGVTLNEDSMKSAIAQAMGMKAMGSLRSSGNRTITPPDDNGNRVDPPQIPPTRTRTQVPVENKELTEDDRIAMKFAGLSPNNPEHIKEYWSLTSGDKMTLSVHKKPEAK